MKSTGRYSGHEEIEMNPSKPFLNDLNKDLYSIDKHYQRTTALNIKMEMIEAITKNIKR